jgi:hypothetical protein
MANTEYVRIPAKDLPDLFYIPDDANSPGNGGKNVYFARYRIISDDGKLASKWSQNFEVSTEIYSDDLALTTSEWKAGISSSLLSVTWNVNRLITNKKMFVKKFHVYARFHTGSSTDQWQFMQETSNTNFSTIMPSGKNKADIAVLLPTYRGLDADNTLGLNNSGVPISPMTLFPESVIFYEEDVS